MIIPTVDLRALHQELHPEIETVFNTVLDQSSFLDGPLVDQFEKEFAAYCGVRQAVTCANGTEATCMALMFAGVREGDEVITTANALGAVDAISKMHAHPTFVDIDWNTYQLCPNALRTFLEEKCQQRNMRDGGYINKATGRRISCILPVHLYGMMADMESILNLAKPGSLPVVEDASQALGAVYRMGGQAMKAGSLGQAGVFNFSPRMGLGAMSNGGAVISSDDLMIQYIRLIRNHSARSMETCHLQEGSVGQLGALQCGILEIKLKKVDEWIAQRRQVARWYNERLGGNRWLSLPVVAEGQDHTYHQYVVSVLERQWVMKRLAEVGIATSVPAPAAAQLHNFLRILGCPPGNLPNTERASRSLLGLPMYPQLTEEMVDFICQRLLEVL